MGERASLYALINALKLLYKRWCPFEMISCSHRPWSYFLRSKVSCEQVRFMSDDALKSHRKKHSWTLKSKILASSTENIRYYAGAWNECSQSRGYAWWLKRVTLELPQIERQNVRLKLQVFEGASPTRRIIADSRTARLFVGVESVKSRRKSMSQSLSWPCKETNNENTCHAANCVNALLSVLVITTLSRIA